MAKIIALVKMVVTSATGLVSFVTDIVRPVKVTCEFSPVQEGTGDPSPDNVRPISGWTGCEIPHAGINIWDEVLESGYWNVSDGGKAQSGRYLRCANHIPVAPNTEYYFMVGSSGSYQRVLLFFNRDKEILTWKYFNNFSRHTTPDNCYYIAFYVTKDYGTEYNNDISINYPATETEYHPHKSGIIPINWQSEAGTVYGGTVTLNEDGSADLVVTHRYAVYDGDENWKWSLNNGRYNANITASGIYRPSYQSMYAIPCNYAKPGSNTVTTYFAVGATWQDSQIYFFNPITYLDGVEDLATFKAYLAEHPLEVVYPLATPLTYHFDNIGQLQSFLGTNNIWHNMNGDITVEYLNKQ